MAWENEARQFADEGWAVFEGALAGELLELLREHCDRFVAREDARMAAAGVDQLGLSHRGKRYFANECQREIPALRRMLFSPVMAEVCAATLGPDAYFFLDQYVVKGAEEGLAFGWHQDSGYVVGNGGPEHPAYLTCWCPLDDVTAENGTVRLVPFSAAPSSREIIQHRRTGAGDLVVDAAEDRAVTVPAKAGDVVVFSSRLLHATGPNQTPNLRRVYLAQYTPQPLLDASGRHLRRNAIAFLRDGRQVTHG